ncbi:MAG: radical SAM protein [Candidatus Gracilibacteria bacterium]|nr:radical SAM protein [Candidatus Gracilibacteria bacterium]
MEKLKHIEINIGKACNNRCRFCMTAKSVLWNIKFVGIDILKEKIKNYAEKGYNSIGFLGGDISIYPKLDEVMATCKNNGFVSVNIISNGMKFDDINFIEKLVKSGLTRINISIHSHLQIIEDYLTQVEGGLDRKLKAIDNINLLYNRGLLISPLSINIVLNQKNYKTIIETVLFYRFKKGINDIRINFVWLNDDVREEWDGLKIMYTEVLLYFKKLIYLSNKYNIRITFDSIPPCIFYKIDKNNYKYNIKKFLGENQDHIDEIDDTSPDVVENFNWQDYKKNVLKIKYNKCKSCNYINNCQGIRKGYDEVYGDTEFTPIN